MPTMKRRQRPVTGSRLLSQQVFDGLRDEIATGQLKPGDRLSLRRIADRYSVSPMPVMMALARLEQTGLIESGQSETASVRRVTLESIHSENIIREAIETQAIRLACESATSSELDDLYRLAERIDLLQQEASPEYIEEGPRVHWAFHRGVAELSRYGALVRELERITVLAMFRDGWLRTVQPPCPTTAHRQIVDAIRSRDADAAEKEMRAHVRRGLENQLRTFMLRSMQE